MDKHTRISSFFTFCGRIKRTLELRNHFYQNSRWRKNYGIICEKEVASKILESQYRDSRFCGPNYTAYKALVRCPMIKKIRPAIELCRPSKIVGPHAGFSFVECEVSL